MTYCKKLVAAAAATLLLLPATASAKPSGKPHARIVIHPNAKRHWHGYGFLPGYRPQLAETNGLPILGPDPRPKREIRYFDYYGNVRYGWGGPGYYRGRYNGGSFGPCWTYTPIGPMWNCGR